MSLLLPHTTNAKLNLLSQVAEFLAPAGGKRAAAMRADAARVAMAWAKEEAEVENSRRPTSARPSPSPPSSKLRGKSRGIGRGGRRGRGTLLAVDRVGGAGGSAAVPGSAQAGRRTVQPRISSASSCGVLTRLTGTAVA